jgi:integrase
VALHQSGALMGRPSFAELLTQPGRHNQGDSLYLTVRGPKSARWEFQMRAPGTKSLKSHWLGSAVGPAAISLTEARQARAAKWLEIRGMAPARQAVAATTDKTFADVVPEWLAVAAVKWADKTKAGVSASLLRLPFAHRAARTIKTQDVLDALLPLPERQRQDVRQNLARALDFASGRKWVAFDADGNPAKFEGTRRELWPVFKKSDKNLPAVPWQELPATFKTLPQSEVGRAVRFNILTVARPGEVEGATWGQIVGENGSSAWIIPADEMKGRKAHRVPLTKAALALLGTPGKPDAPLFTLASNQMLNALQDVAPGMSLHATARAGFKTWASDNAKDRELTERSLAHKFGGKVENAYQRTDLIDRRRELMNEWAAFATGR